jgi:hypothetical protein
VSRALGGLALLLSLPACAEAGCSKPDRSAANSAASVATAAAQPPPAVTAQPVSAAPERFGVTALSHLPAGCSVAGRVEWRVLANHPLLSPMVRKALNPDPKEITTAEQKSFLAFLEQARLDPQRDIEQIALCYARAADPLVIIAGALPKDLVPLMETLAPKSERYQILQQQGALVLSRAGRNLVQADDRALLLGSDLASVLAARQLSSSYLDYGLPERGELAFVGEGDLLRGLFATLLPPPFGQLAGRTEQLRANFVLATQELTITAQLPSAEEAEVLKSGLGSLLQAQGLEAGSPSAGVPGATAPGAGLRAAALKQAVQKTAASAQWDVQDKLVRLRVTLPLMALGLALSAP